MEFICGYFDVQGFYKNDRFHPREAAILVPGFCLRTSVDPMLGELSKEEERQANYLTNFHHGLTIKPKKGAVDHSTLCFMLKILYALSKKQEQFLIACKSKEAAAILESLYIPKLNLCKYGGTYKNIQSNRIECCHLHSIPNALCSLKIVMMMKKWVESQ